jgi:hypothetical protein
MLPPFCALVAVDSACPRAGAPELVIDWKSDVAPGATTIAGYAAQVRTYLRATGAARGLVVFMTSGRVVRVELE